MLGDKREEKAFKIIIFLLVVSTSPKTENTLLGKKNEFNLPNGTLKIVTMHFF